MFLKMRVALCALLLTSFIAPEVAAMRTDWSISDKKTRSSRACNECRKNRIKCDADYPCGPCLEANTAELCVYEIPKKRGRKRNPDHKCKYEDQGRPNSNVPTFSYVPVDRNDPNNIKTFEAHVSERAAHKIVSKEPDESEVQYKGTLGEAENPIELDDNDVFLKPQSRNSNCCPGPVPYTRQEEEEIIVVNEEHIQQQNVQEITAEETFDEQEDSNSPYPHLNAIYRGFTKKK